MLTALRSLDVLYIQLLLYSCLMTRHSKTLFLLHFCRSWTLLLVYSICICIHFLVRIFWYISYLLEMVVVLVVTYLRLRICRSTFMLGWFTSTEITVVSFSWTLVLYTVTICTLQSILKSFIFKGTLIGTNKSIHVKMLYASHCFCFKTNSMV